MLEVRIGGQKRNLLQQKITVQQFHQKKGRTKLSGLSMFCLGNLVLVVILDSLSSVFNTSNGFLFDLGVLFFATSVFRQGFLDPFFISTDYISLLIFFLTVATAFSVIAFISGEEKTQGPASCTTL